MNREDVFHLAHKAGLMELASGETLENLEHFAALVEAAEREACAGLCEEHWFIDGLQTAKEFAALIRRQGAPC